MFEHLEVQLKRTKGYRMPPGCVKVARPTRYGNPFETAAEYRIWLTTDWVPDANKNPHWKIFRLDNGTWNYPMLEERKRWILANIPLLRNTPVSCFCPLEATCHRRVVIELANK